MRFKINKSAIVHYMLIYLMILAPGSSLFAIRFRNILPMISVAVFCVAAVFYRRLRQSYGIIYVTVLFFFVLLLRLKTGSVGLNAWMLYASVVLLVQAAILFDVDKFLERWLKTVVFFTCISLVMWTVFCLLPGLVRVWPADSYYVQTMGTEIWTVDYHAKGLFFYSFYEIHPFRNCGIFSEPGVHQIMLNGALFVMLFWRDKLTAISSKTYVRFLVIVLLGIFSCQSTTGYIAFAIIVLVYVIFHKGKNTDGINIKALIVAAICIMVIGLGVDFSANGKESVFYTQIVEKLFPSGNTLDFSTGTGQYRTSMIEYAFKVFREDPFGVGYDKFRAGVENGAVAGALVVYAAVFGIIPWLYAMCFLIRPVIKFEKKYIAILFIALYVNTSLAQTSLFYTSQLLIPMYLYFENVHKKRGLYEDTNIVQ